MPGKTEKDRQERGVLILALLENDVLAHFHQVGFLRMVRQFLHNQYAETHDPMFVVGANAVARLILEIDLHTIVGGSIYRNIPNEQNLLEN
jgi:hypothetical protein